MGESARSLHGARETAAVRTLEVRLLGRTRLVGPRSGEAGVELAGRRAAVALARLALERGGAVSRDELADTIWDELPSSWRASLRNVVTDLRRSLSLAGADPSVALVTDGEAYRLVLHAPECVDLLRLQAAADEAEEAIRRDEFARTLSLATPWQFVAATTVLQGAAGRWAESVREQSRESWRRLQRAAGEAALGLGQVDAAEAIARRLLAAAPVREDAQRLLMRALSASGNRAQALRSYDAFRRELAAELGVTPSRATEQLFVELLADERAPADPRMAARVSAVAGGPLLLAPAAPPSAVSEQRLEELVGRLAGTPAGSRMAVVSGGQGSGKTRLAADFAALALARGLPVLYGREDPSLPAPLSGILSPLAAALGTLAPGAVDTLMRAAPGPLAVLGADPIDPAAGLAAPRLGLAESSLSAIVESLELIAGDRGALLVLDDAQTASAATVEVLATLLEDHAELALTTVVLLRDPAASDPLQQLRDHPRVVSFALSSTH